MNLVPSLIADVPDWPKPGIVFKDITPLPASPEGLWQTVDAIATSVPEAIDVVVGMEARGSTFIAPVALALGVSFVSVQKPRKLPRPVLSESPDPEYSTATLTMHADALVTGARVLVVDDAPATGGIVAATAVLLKRFGAELMHVSVFLEPTALGGRERLTDQRISGCSAVPMSQGRGQTEEAGPQGVCYLDGEHAPPTGAVAT